MNDLDRHIERLKSRGYAWPIPWECVERMARFENCKLVAYKCPAGVWTIGWGETEEIKPGMRWTEDQVDARYYTEVVKYARKVEAMCTVDPTPNQLGGLCMLAYNIGLRNDEKKSGLYHSSVLRLHNAGNFDAAARAFHLYNKARNQTTGKLEVLPGLVTRRAWEAAVYLQPEDDSVGDRMPQAVAEESKLAASPIAQGGAITTAVGAAAGATELVQQIDQTSGVLGSVKSAFGTVRELGTQVADFIGVPPVVIVAFVLIAAGVIITRNRRKQRAEGWA